MLGVSRHTYTLAINRQIPSWLGKLEKRRATPYVAITIAHLSIIRLRITMPDKLRPFRIPWGMAWGPATLPIPAIIAAVASGFAFLSVLAFHSTARWVGIGWMAFGLTFYVVYRKYIEGTSLTKRVQVGEAALTKQIPTVEFSNLLVPVFGTQLDDDIVATAGRLAAAEQEEGGGDGEPHLELVYVIEVPLSLPLDAELPPEREAQARRALDRAREVGEEYEDVEVSTEVVRARRVGAGIIEAARRANSEAIVIGAEPPTKIRGGGRFGGIGAAKPAEIGAATEYVLKKAPCRVLLTAPPEPETGPSPRPTEGRAPIIEDDDDD
jgi:APA family basic amino acid/polyamine antiporter